MAIALEMEIERYLVFDRKIYNYFDLPKGFQITQRKPFAKNGSFFLIEKNGNLKEIKIKSLQLEEDTGKSIYSSNSDVKLDFNRSGNPLIELVTDPIFGNIDEVCEFIKQLQFFLTYLGISDAKMEKGQLRVDLNFSIKSNDKKYSTPRYEIKNLNSINNVKNSIKYELGKHKEIISKGKEIPESHTLSFNEGKKSTIPSREKKEYFYVPEVNIPPIKISEDDIYLLKNTIPTPH
jgi:aspartyl-tRNA(Asn)/glutamyl-tRNA(Gln) amidotransferase subunit B